MQYSVKGTRVPDNALVGVPAGPEIANVPFKDTLMIKNANVRTEGGAQRLTTFIAVIPGMGETVVNIDGKQAQNLIRRAAAENDLPIPQALTDYFVAGEVTGLLSITYVPQDEPTGEPMMVEVDGVTHQVYGRVFQVSPMSFKYLDISTAKSFGDVLKDHSVSAANSRASSVLDGNVKLARFGGRGNAQTLEVTADFVL